MSLRPTSKLWMHPDNEYIYSDGASQELIDSIKAVGILEPIVIDKNHMIISGHRRYDAAKQLKLRDVPVSVVEIPNVSDIDYELQSLEHLLHANKYRDRTNSQNARAYIRYIERAENAQGKRKDLRTNESIEKELSTSFVRTNEVKPSEKASELIGQNISTLSTGAQVWRVIEMLYAQGNERGAKYLHELLDESVKRAYQFIKSEGLKKEYDLWINPPEPETKPQPEPVQEKVEPVQVVETKTVLPQPTTKPSKEKQEEVEPEPEPEPEPADVYCGMTEGVDFEWQMNDKKASDHMIVKLTQYNLLNDNQKTFVLNYQSTRSAGFNMQKGDSIEWAQWSWNPVTGCKHECPYCYARDIAERFYQHGFEPAIIPSRLSAPYSKPVPAQAETDTSYKNVFVCSMADLFGRWVPTEWIQSVLDVCEDNPQWNFLFLTKFPIRMSEFNFPDNCWVGTTVDHQARVKNAEKAFAKVNAKVKWLSIEPMLTPLEFNDLSMFQWVVIGGSSASNETPEWKPPFEWIANLTQHAWECGTKVYFKTNLLERVKQFPLTGQDTETRQLPEALRYLPDVE